jgi:hypothetical protein
MKKYCIPFVVLAFCFTQLANALSPIEEQAFRRPRPTTSYYSRLVIEGGADSLAQKLFRLMMDDYDRSNEMGVEKKDTSLFMRGNPGDELRCDEKGKTFECVFPRTSYASRAGMVGRTYIYSTSIQPGLIHASSIGKLFKLMHRSKVPTLDFYDVAQDIYRYSVYDGTDAKSSLHTMTCEISSGAVASYPRNVSCSYKGAMGTSRH